ERAGRAKGAAALELLARQRAGLVRTVERCQQRRRVGTPGAECGRMDFPLLLEATAVEQIFECLLRVLQGRSYASTRSEVPEVTVCCGSVLNLRKDIVCLCRPAPREQNVDQCDAAERKKARHTGMLERGQCIRLGVGERPTAQVGVRAQLSRHRER